MANISVSGSPGGFVALFAIAGAPILLTGAALVGLPILLHLIMRQEPKRLPFPAFRFLKQRKQINQRKIRLRHFLLLAMRMALIALICLSLFQPTVLSEGFSLHGERPIATVIVLDTSPSMGYVLSERTGLTEARQRGLKLLDEQADGPWTCLDESRGRIMEILEELPAASRVAIVDTSERQAFWSTTIQEARQRVRSIRKPRANSLPVSQSLLGAYDLLAKIDSELEPGQEPLPRLVLVFSDRTVPSWDSSRLTELQAARDRVAAPSPLQVFVDVGVEKPLNMAITSVQMRPQIVPANQPAIVEVTVEGTAGTGENILVFSLNGEEQRSPVMPLADRPITKQFRKDGLKPGLYQGKITLQTTDGLPFDNERYISFRVREPRRVLAVVDPPVASLVSGGIGYQFHTDGQAFLWKLALESSSWYAVDVASIDAAVRLDLTKYSVVTMLGLTEPTRTLWEQAADYVAGNGKLIIVPGGPTMNPAAYQTDAAAKVLPRKFAKWRDLPKGDYATWTWKSLSDLRPMLRAFRDYQSHSDFFEKQPPNTSGFWQVEDGAIERVVVSYNDAPEPAQRSPAVLSLRTGGDRDSVLQLTVPMASGCETVHDYGNLSWFYAVLVNEAVRSLTGDAEDAVFNHANGEFVPARWPASDVKAIYYLSGPDVSANDAAVKRDADFSNVYMRSEKTIAAGNFTVTSADNTWSDGFSLNVPGSESNLARMEAKDIEDLFGPESVYTADKQLAVAEILSGKFTQPIELFPMLMILLLLILAVENLLANRFYRKRRA